jgi:hypothetical protein
VRVFAATVQVYSTGAFESLHQPLPKRVAVGSVSVFVQIPLRSSRRLRER